VISFIRHEWPSDARQERTAVNEFELTITIERPIEAVWTYSQDLSRYPEWNPGVIAARQTSPGPMQVGATLAFTGKLLGRSYESQAECTAYIPMERFTSRSTSGPFLLEVDTRLEPVDGGTKMTSTYRGESRGFMKLAEPVAVRVARKQFEAANENLKALLESEPVPE
jgi:uncharacterized protein YndB with AHSA1/START domain